MSDRTNTFYPNMVLGDYTRKLPDVVIITHKYLITPQNIELYRKDMYHGSVSRNNKVIVLNKYTLAPDLKLEPDDPIISRIAQIDKERPITIAHEFKHVLNAAFGTARAISRNYYEMSYLLAMDEVSAFSCESFAEHAPQGRDAVFAAVLNGAEMLLDSIDYYRGAHMQYIYDAWRRRHRCGVRENLWREINMNPPIYSRRFNRVVAGYMTFGAYRLMDARYPMPSELAARFDEIRQVYEYTTRDTLRDILARQG